MTTYRKSPDGEHAMTLLEKQGFIFPVKPKDAVELPSDLSDLDGPDLMEIFVAMTAWADYASAQVGLAVIAEREAQHLLDWREADVWRGVSKSSVTAAKAMVALDSSVQDAITALDEAHAYRRLVTDLAARYERDAAVMSRELTRRTSEHGPKSSRRERWST